MRKFGLIAGIVGFGVLGVDLLLRWLTNFSSWLWLPGFLALAAGGAVFVWFRASPVSPVIPAPKASPAVNTATGRLLDNFDERFAELKSRKASDSVVGDLYLLGTQLEQRGRSRQATAVYRALTRIDNSYRDVSVRLKRLIDADLATAAPPEPPGAHPAQTVTPAATALVRTAGAAPATTAIITSTSTTAAAAAPILAHAAGATAPATPLPTLKGAGAAAAPIPATPGAPTLMRAAGTGAAAAAAPVPTVKTAAAAASVPALKGAGAAAAPIPATAAAPILTRATAPGAAPVPTLKGAGAGSSAPIPATAVAAATIRIPAAAAATATATTAAATATRTPTTAGAPVGRAADAHAKGQQVQSLGRYQLEREIGRGAMGTVYLGRDTAINRQVAIKAIPLAIEFSDAELADARTRFFREAETAGGLNHPNIVTIYDVGEERGLAYIAMEYLKGRHLSDYAKSHNLLEPRKVLEIVARTANALGFAHKQQVVHRDIKPANLMYDPVSDVLKITDFGIARLTGSGATRTGIVLGTPSFMSPEQLEGRTVTGQSDLFSLGVSLFQLLTSRLPFAADSMTGLMQQIAEVPHPPLRAFRPDLPDCVDKIIDRALAKSPDARFDSGAQMAAALEDCRSRIPSGLP